MWLSLFGALTSTALCLLYPISALGFGLWIGKLFKENLLSSQEQRELSGSGLSFEKSLGLWGLLVLGLLLQLLLSLAIFSLGVPIEASSLLPLALGLLNSSLYRLRFKFRLSFTGSLWFLVILALAVTLFDALDGIATPWRNNYGDLTFHLGMISQFTFGEAGFPEYHIFPGETLSYPFLFNFWTALLWWPSKSFEVLSLIFAFQFFFVFFVVWKTFKSPNWSALPWAIIFGGGSLLYLGEPSGELIANGHPWTPFLLSVWIPQRTSLFGLLVLMAVYNFLRPIVWNSSSAPQMVKVHVACLALTLALSPLAHTHMALTAGLISLIFLSLRPALSGNESEALKHFYLFCGICCVSLLFIPFLAGKTSMIGLMNGWSTGPDSSFFATLRIWGLDAAPWMLFLIITIFALKNLALAVTIPLVFVWANVVSLTQWEWDQLKIFLAIYVLSLLFAENVKGKKRLALELLAVLLALPTVLNLFSLLAQGPMHKVYTKNDVQIAESIRRTLRKEEKVIIAAAPKHNSLVTLTGFPLYYGYEGTLHSHALQYLERKKIADSLAKLCSCEGELCPTHLLWKSEEQKHFRMTTPPKDCLQLSELQDLYVFNRSSQADAKSSTASGDNVAAPANE